jgi:Uma2 family endonuclease
MLAHQLLVLFVLNRLNEYAKSRGDMVALPAPLPIQIPERSLRHPDVLLVRKSHVAGFKRPLTGADLAVEVMSEGAENRARDEEVKPREYALAGIPEYWIVDPERRAVQVLVLEAATSEYALSATCRDGDLLVSPTHGGLTLDVAALFRAGETLSV